MSSPSAACWETDFGKWELFSGLGMISTCVGSTAGRDDVALGCCGTPQKYSQQLFTVRETNNYYHIILVFSHVQVTWKWPLELMTSLI